MNEHLKYEYDMLNITINKLKIEMDPVWYNIIYESFCIHAVNILNNLARTCILPVEVKNIYNKINNQVLTYNPILRTNIQSEKVQLKDCVYLAEWINYDK